MASLLMWGLEFAFCEKTQRGRWRPGWRYQEGPGRGFLFLLAKMSQENECLNRHWFRTMEEAKVEVMQWQYQYNNVRPHSSLNYLPPVAFAEKAA